MATQPISERFVPLEEYLSTSYEPDCEYDGRRGRGAQLGRVRACFPANDSGYHLYQQHGRVGSLGLTEQRVQIAARRFLVPDLCVLRLGSPTEDILTRPPLIAIEILSPEDTIRRAAKKACRLSSVRNRACLGDRSSGAGGLSWYGHYAGTDSQRRTCCDGNFYPDPCG